MKNLGPTDYPAMYAAGIAAITGAFASWFTSYTGYTAPPNPAPMPTSVVVVGTPLPAKPPPPPTLQSITLGMYPAVYYRMNETTGTVAYDSSPSTKNGTYSATGVTLGQSALTTNDAGAPVFATGSMTTGIVGSNPAVAGGAISVAAWIKTGATVASQTIVANGKTDNGTNKGFELQISSGSSFVFDVGAGGTDRNRYNGTATANTVYYVVGTYDGTNTKLYINGVYNTSTATSAANITPDTYPVTVGWNSAYPGNYFAGTISEVAIFPTALTSTQITSLYTQATGSTPAPTPSPTPYAIPYGTVAYNFDPPASYVPYSNGNSPFSVAVPTTENPISVGTPPATIVTTPLLDSNDTTKITWMQSLTNNASGYTGIFHSNRIYVPGILNNNNDYQLPFYFSKTTDPYVTLTCFEAYGTCPFTSTTKMYVPANAISQANGNGDGHLVVIQPNGVEFDIYESRNGGTWANGSTYSVGWGGIITDLDIHSGWGGGVTVAGGADLMGGVVRLPELLAGPGGIHHAIAVSVSCGGNTSVYPATATATQACLPSTNNPTVAQDIPLGSHLWLDTTHAQIDALKNMYADQKTVLYAMHDYGLYVEDTNSNQFTMNLQWTPESQMPGLLAGNDTIGAHAPGNMPLWYNDGATPIAHDLYHLDSGNIQQSDGTTPYNVISHLHVLNTCESHNPRTC